MLNIEKRGDIQTVIATYDVTPGSFTDLLNKLQEAYERFLRHQPGFIAAGIHVNDAHTRIANYSQWRSREDFQALLRSEEMQEWNRQFSDLSKSFAPIMYEVMNVYDSPA
ncbi:MAG: antibiotic biosynthesis monooxygenase family protein [Pseudorhodobacter sp.]